MTEAMKDILVCAIAAKIEMGAKGVSCAHDDCPSCGSEGTFKFQLAPNGHVRGKCVAEGCTVEVME